MCLLISHHFQYARNLQSNKAYDAHAFIVITGFKDSNLSVTLGHTLTHMRSHSVVTKEYMLNDTLHFSMSPPGTASSTQAWSSSCHWYPLSRSAFFRSGRITECLNFVGKQLEDREALISMVRNGDSRLHTSFTNHAGTASSWYVLVGVERSWWVCWLHLCSQWPF